MSKTPRKTELFDVHFNVGPILFDVIGYWTTRV